jgi:hypothetical protein
VLDIRNSDGGDQANAIALTDHGKIVAVGMQAASAYVWERIESACRFHSDGTADSTFGDDGCVAMRPLSGSSEQAG